MRFWAKKVRFWPEKNAKLGIGLSMPSSAPSYMSIGLRLASIPVSIEPPPKFLIHSNVSKFVCLNNPFFINFVSWIKNTKGFNISILAVRLSRLPDKPLQLIPIIFRLLFLLLFCVLLVCFLFTNTLVCFDVWCSLKKEIFRDCHANTCNYLTCYKNLQNRRLQSLHGETCTTQSFHKNLYSSRDRNHFSFLSSWVNILGFFFLGSLSQQWIFILFSWLEVLNKFWTSHGQVI